MFTQLQFLSSPILNLSIIKYLICIPNNIKFWSCTNCHMFTPGTGGNYAWQRISMAFLSSSLKTLFRCLHSHVYKVRIIITWYISWLQQLSRQQLTKSVASVNGTCIFNWRERALYPPVLKPTKFPPHVILLANRIRCSLSTPFATIFTDAATRCRQPQKDEIGIKGGAIMGGH